MLPKTLLVLACLCLARAAVVINAPNDIDENYVDQSAIEVKVNKDDNADVAEFSIAQTASEEADVRSTSPRACSNSFCNSLCRSLGHSSGRCVNANTCRCYRFLAFNDNDDVSENVVEINKDENQDDSKINAENDDAQDHVRTATDEASAESASARACTISFCRSLCRSLGFSRGVCINANTCRCYRSLLALSEHADQPGIEVKVNKDDNANVAEFSIAQTVSEEAHVMSTSPRACTNSFCNSLCRALGYSRGQCVSANTCRCYRFLAFNDNGDVSENVGDINKDENQDDSKIYAENDDAQDHVQTATDEASAESASARACTISFCNSLCRSLGFSRGVCINANTCRCYRSLLALSEHADQPGIEVKVNKDDNADVAELSIAQTVSEEAHVRSTSPRACTNSFCNSLCRSLGFSRGVCRNANTCRCSRSLLALSEYADQPEIEVKINKDENADVAEFSISQTASEEAHVSSTSPRACTNSFCNSLCRSLGFSRGVCINANTCRCYRSLLALSEYADQPEIEVKINKDENADVAEFSIAQTASEEAHVRSTSPRACTNSFCNSLCRSLGFSRGVCINANTCRCYRSLLALSENIAETENDIKAQKPMFKHNLDSKAASTSLRDCNPLWCDQTCRRIGNSGGVCVNGRCKCDLLRSGANRPYETRANCVDYMCAETCRRMNYRGGHCTGDSCVCFN